jgi:hypothetical protein
VSSRGVAGCLSSRRPLPPVIVFLLAALAVALGTAPGARSGSATADVVGSLASPAAEAAHVGIIGAHRHGTPPVPSRLGVRGASPAGSVLERPTFDAVLPALAVAGPLVALLGEDGANDPPGDSGLSGGSARSPPASAA